MANSEHEELKGLLHLLEQIEELIDDESMCEDDPDEYYLEVLNLNETIEKSFEDILEQDPELPVSHKLFRDQISDVLNAASFKYEMLQSVSVDTLVPLIKELRGVLGEDTDGVRRNLFDQLTIPIMSLVNHQEHPTRPGYLVYHFKIAEHATYFEELLKEKDLFYERFDEARQGESVFWFGVRDRDHDAVEIINYTVKGKFRKPMIHDKGARYFVVALGILIILLAIIGAVMNNL